MLLGIAMVLGSTRTFTFISNIVYHFYLITSATWTFILRPSFDKAKSSTTSYQKAALEALQNTRTMIIEAAQILFLVVYHLPTRLDDAFVSMFASMDSHDLDDGASITTAYHEDAYKDERGEQSRSAHLEPELTMLSVASSHGHQIQKQIRYVQVKRPTARLALTNHSLYVF